MARFQNFSQWRGRLPHWRADGETYYVTFRHRRDLEEGERRVLIHHLLKSQRRKLDLSFLAILPQETHLIFRVQQGPDGQEYELSDVIEKAKRKAGAQIIKTSGEKWPPFSTESFDRIIRDEAELEETLARLWALPEQQGLCEASEEYEFLWTEQAP
jgi:hypothetical protein